MRRLCGKNYTSKRFQNKTRSRNELSARMTNRKIKWQRVGSVKSEYGPCHTKTCMHEMEMRDDSVHVRRDNEYIYHQ